ncbi:MAG: PD40 domain-containing protein, partial [Deinococcus sp.]|nr:PD40 domain-containing protein [Deinococcus sp.]
MRWVLLLTLAPLALASGTPTWVPVVAVVPHGRPTWSPDGTRLAFSASADGQSDLYVVNTDGTDLVQLTNDPFEDRGPAWSPDG